jgi:hypothetical protein
MFLSAPAYGTGLAAGQDAAQMHHGCRVAAVAAHAARWLPGLCRPEPGQAPSEKGSVMNTTATSKDQQYVAPGLVDLGPATEVTLGKYAEDTQDENRYFE